MAQIGERIGPFELVERVVHGRRTSVFRGLRTEAGPRRLREVAIRVAETADGAAPDPEVLAAIKAEYDLLRLLEDDRIPAPVAHYPGHGAAAYEWVEGVSLRDVLRLAVDKRLDLEAATSLDILVELAYALRHAHALVREEGKIVHGTLAPDIVRLTPEGKVKLFGFGDPEPRHAWPLAPEQQRGVVEARTDQWLLGALALELLRHSPEMLAAADASVETVFARIQARWPAVARVLARALSEAPADRYDAEERLIKDLLALTRAVGGVSRRGEVAARAIQMTASQGVPEPAGARTRPRSRVQSLRERAASPSRLMADTTPPTPAAPVPFVPPPEQAPSTWPTETRALAASPDPVAAVAAPAASPAPRTLDLLDFTTPEYAGDVEPTLVEPIGTGRHVGDHEVTHVGDPAWEETGDFAPSDEPAPRPRPALRLAPRIEAELAASASPSPGIAAVRPSPAPRPAPPDPTEPFPVAFDLSAPLPERGDDADAEATEVWQTYVEPPKTGVSPAIEPAASLAAPAPTPGDPPSIAAPAEPSVAATPTFVEPAEPEPRRDDLPADTVPDRWVFGAVAVFAVVAVAALAWRILG